MFRLEWYGVAGVPEPSAAPAGGHDAPRTRGTALSVVRWLMLLTIAVTIGRSSSTCASGAGPRTDTSVPVTVLAALTAALLATAC